MGREVVDVFENGGYRLFKDESYKNDNAEERKKKWPYYELRGKRGVVYPYSQTQLAAQFFKNNRQKPAKFVKSRGYKVLQDSDDMIVVLFPVSDFGEIADRLLLKKKRVISEAHKKKLLEGRNRLKEAV